MFIPKDKVQWKKVKYIKLPLETTDEAATWLYELWLNEPLASWDVFSYWEVERILSMRKHLVKGDVLMDIGTEQGWCNLVYAHMVGPENMVLIEPTPEFWPNIKALWEKNFSTSPLACFPGFMSDQTTDQSYFQVHQRSFPLPQSKGSLIDRNSYKNLSDDSHTMEVSQMTLDDFVRYTKIVPQAITIDVEGAELLVLKGAEKTLTDQSIKVWVSEHGDLALENYNVKPDDVRNFMDSLGYRREFLAKDHETHVYYSKDL